MNMLHLKTKKWRETLNGFSLFFDILCAICVGCALSLDMNLRSRNTYYNWSASFPDTLSVSVSCVLMLYVLRNIRRKLPSLGWPCRMLSVFLGAWWVMARSVLVTMNVQQPFLTSGQMLKACVMAFGIACIYDLFFRLLSLGLEGGFDLSIGQIGESWIGRMYRAHTALFSMVVLLLLWLPHLIVGFPGSTNSDTAWQYRMVLNLCSWNINHPLLYTALLECFVRLGELFGGGNLSMYLLVLAQAAFAVAVMGYSQSIMRRMGTPVWLRVGSLAVCGLMPVYCDNITVLLKDVPYAYATVLLVCEVVRSEFLEENTYCRSIKGMFRFIGAALVLLAVRNNGMGILVPVIVIMGLRALCRKDLYRVIRTLALILIPVALTSAAKVSYSKGKVLNEIGLDGALSFPLQQTARFVIEHAEEIPENERAIIDEVLDYNMIPYRYDPIISDPIKSIFRADVTSKELRAYFGVWMQQFVRDPWCYFSATFVQNALLFDPQTNNLVIFGGTGLFEDVAQELQVFKPAVLESLETRETYIRHLLLPLPLIAQLNSVGFYCILVLGVCMIACRKKVRGLLIVLLPSLCTMVMIILGATMTNQDRYGFPIIYCMPILLACLSYGLRKKKNCEELQG